MVIKIEKEGMLDINRIYNEDCFEFMKSIPDSSIDLILTDPPYSMTKNSWDTDFDVNLMWEHFLRITKPNAAIIIFGQDKFSAKMMLSSKYHRYNLIWKKGERVSGFLNSKRMPLRNHEDIMIFYKELPTYNPQFEEGQPTHAKGNIWKDKEVKNNNYGYFKNVELTKGSTQKYPKSIINFDRPHPPIHPTQKSVDLGRYLCRMYSNEGDLIFDPFCGVSTFPLSAKLENRNYIGCELNEEYFNKSLLLK